MWNETAIKLLMKSLLMTCRIGTILANWSTNYFFLHWYPYNIATKIIFLFHIHSPFDPIQKVAGTIYASRQKSLLVTKIIILRLKPFYLEERPAQNDARIPNLLRLIEQIYVRLLRKYRYRFKRRHCIGNYIWFGLRDHTFREQTGTSEREVK